MPPSITELVDGESERTTRFEEKPDASRPLTEFLDCIETGALHRCDARGQLAVVELIDSAYSSIREGRAVDVDLRIG